ncbi:xylulokinase [Clostridia bacterium]|nr:xylulokinase [Clostridia bacterium]
MKYFLGIDIGTSGTKAILTGEDGAVIRSAVAEYPLSTPKNGWAEQHPDLWRNAVVKTVREVVGFEDVAAVGLTGQMHGLVMLDKDDKVIRPAILWCDQRTAAECAEITEKVGAARLIELTANPALTGFTAPKILWVRKHEPENYSKCVKIMLPKDYIRYELTGDHASDVSDASGTGLLNVAERNWSDEVLEKLSIDRVLLGKLYESCEVTGHISERAAALTGLKAGTPVVAGAGDNAAAAIGTGVDRDGRAFVTVGTSGVLFAHTSKMRLDPKGRVHTFCAAVPGEWHIMGVTLAAGLSLQWLRNNFLEGTGYKELDRLAGEIPIGSNRLLYLPYLNGERTPHLDPDCRGAFVGLSSSHGKADVVRSVMEGVSFSLKDCQDVIVEMGADLGDVTACGGGGSSPFWRKMLADVFGCNVNTVQSSDGPALGAAMLAAVGAGTFKSVGEACDKVILSGDRVTPDKNATAKYATYHSIYKSLYDSLKSDFAALAKIEE